MTEIVKRVDPSWSGTIMPPSYSTHDGERIVRQALGAVRDREELEAHLAPAGPMIAAETLHPLVWQAASVVWPTGEYKLANQQAAAALSAHIRKRVGSTLSDRKLVQQAFAPDAPKPRQNRLHFPGDTDDENWLSRQQGLHLISQGAYAGIRNIAVHEPSEWSEHEGVEHLAVLSVVARWTDETRLVTVP